ncbi:hypothetical protein ACHWQZ_G017894 [Mnemiopsis leidyi]
MSLNRVRCRLSFNSPKEQSINTEGPSSSASVSSVAANTAVKEQKTVSAMEAHKRRLDYMRGLVDELEKTKWMYPPLPKELCRSNQ